MLAGSLRRLPIGRSSHTCMAANIRGPVAKHVRSQYMWCGRVHATTRRIRPVPSAVDGSAGPSTSGRELGWDDGQLRLLWDSVTRSLLKLGTRGITERHASHLQTLLAQHSLVKVQLNGVDGNEEAAQATAEELAAMANVHLVQRKGSTLLFARPGTDKQQLLELAEQSLEKTKAWKAKRVAARQEKQEVLATSMVKRQANASRSRRQMDRIIGSAVSNSGPLTREGLKQEWTAIARDIESEEAGVPAKGSKAPKPKQPWKRREQQQREQQQRGATSPTAGRQQRPQQ